MARRYDSGQFGAITGNVAGVSRFTNAPINKSDPAGLFDWVGGVVDTATKTAGAVVDVAARTVGGAVGGAVDAAAKAATGVVNTAVQTATGVAGTAWNIAGNQTQWAVDTAIAARQAAEEQARWAASTTAATVRVVDEQARQATALATDVAAERARQVAATAAALRQAAATRPPAGAVGTGVVGATTGGGFLNLASIGGAFGTSIADNLGISGQSEMLKHQEDIARRNAAIADRDRAAQEKAALLAAEDVTKQSTFPDIFGAIGGAVGGAVQGAQALGGAIGTSVGAFAGASVDDKIKGVGDFVAYAPAQAFTNLTVDLGAGLSGIVTGRPVDEAEKQRLKDLQTIYISDAVYNAYATPGSVVDLATAMVDVADEVFGSGDYERTHIADAIKKDIFKRDEIGSHVPGSQLGYGTQYDRDVLKTGAFEQWSADVRADHGDVAGFGADFAGGMITAWHNMPVVEGVMLVGGTGVGSFLGAVGGPLATAFAVEQIVPALADGMLEGGDEEQTSPQSVGTGAPVQYIATPPPVTGDGVVTGGAGSDAEYQALMDQYAAEYAAASEQQIALYQQQVDAEYLRAQQSLEAEYQDAISEYTSTSQEYVDATAAYEAQQRALEEQYLQDQAAYQKEVDDYQRSLDEQYTQEMEDYRVALEIADAQRQQDYLDALAAAQARTETNPGATGITSRVVSSGGTSTVWGADGFVIEPYATTMDGSASPSPATSPLLGASPVLIAGVAGVALLAGAYFLHQRPKHRGGMV